MISFIKICFSIFFKLPELFLYLFYDLYKFLWTRGFNRFYGWGIHLFVGSFGSSKTSTMVAKAYKLAKKYPQLTILTNIELKNFPTWTKILKLTTAQDILNAPRTCLVLIDEIGTIFNSRDFNTSKNAVPKSLYQHLCQCRHREMMIYATVQRYNLLDKQIRDICADVTACKIYFKHPFSRLCVTKTYDIDEYELYQSNNLYRMRIESCSVFIQSEKFRNLYDTNELVTNMLRSEYIDDKAVLDNRSSSSSSSFIFEDKSRKSLSRFKR